MMLTCQRDLAVFHPFHYLPPRKLVDYYQAIKAPTSLNGVWKKVRGISGARGKEQETGQTDFRSWDAFENEFKKIWENARAYNEDGSEIDILSQELEVSWQEHVPGTTTDVVVTDVLLHTTESREEECQ